VVDDEMDEVFRKIVYNLISNQNLQTSTKQNPMTKDFKNDKKSQIP